MWLSASLLVGLPGIPTTVQALNRKALRENWESRPRTGKGGGREYHISSLPAETQAALRGAGDHAPDPVPDFVGDTQAITHYDPVAEQVAREEEQIKIPLDIPEGLDPIALIAADWQSYLGEVGHKQKALALYPDLFNGGQRPVSGLLKWADGRVRQMTVGWLRMMDNQGFRLGKAPAGKRFERIEGDSRLKSTILTWLKGFLKPNKAHLFDLICQQWGPHYVSRTTLYDYCDWLENDPSTRRMLAEFRNPDAARGKYRASAGTQQIESVPNECWEWDGTPADVLLPGYGRYSLLNVVDKFTRRLAVLVWPSVSSQGYGLLAHRQIEAWGLPQRVVSDCGSAEKSVLIRTLWESLGVDYRQTTPYSPERKGTIERHNRLINDWLKLHPNWKGANVAEAQALRQQKAFSQRRGEMVDSIDCTPKDLQVWLDRWLTIYHHESHQGLGGRSPDQVYRQALGQGFVPRKLTSPDALRLLLVPAGKRVVTKGVIRYENAEFCAPELGAVEVNGAEVEVRVDPDDYGRIFVFDRAGTFLCAAINPERQGVDRRAVAFATQAVEKASKKQARQEWRQHQKAAGGDHRELVERLMAGKLAEAEKITALPERVELVAPRAIEEMGKALAAAVETPPAAIPLSAAEEALQQQLIWEDEQRRKAKPLEKTFDRAWRIANAEPDEIDEDDRQWMARYLKTQDGQWFIESLGRPVAI